MTDHVPAPSGAWFFLIYYFLNYSFFQKYSKKFLDAILSLCYYGQCTIVRCYAYLSCIKFDVYIYCIVADAKQALNLKERGEMSMEKNRIRPIAGTKVMRMSYSRQKEVLEMPNLIEVQKDSYQWFLDEGLKVVKDFLQAFI